MVTSCFAVFTLSYLLINFPSGPILNYFGYSPTLKTCTAIIVVAVWLRYYVSVNYPESFVLILACQVLVSTTQCLLGNAGPGIVTRWFPVKEIAFATTLGVLAQTGGLSAGICMATFWIDDDDGKNREQGREHF